jgi:hypothetical protein
MTLWCMRFSRWIIKAKTRIQNTECLLFFDCKNVCTNAQQYCVIPILPVLLILETAVVSSSDCVRIHCRVCFQVVGGLSLQLAAYCIHYRV